MKQSGLVSFHTALEPLLVPIDDVTQHPQNPNNGDVEAIAESIEVNGYIAPLIVQKSSGHIIAGNHRWEALKGLGATEAPVIYVEIGDTAAIRYLLADNRTAALARPDNAALLRLLDGLAEHDTLHGTGFNDFDHQAIKALADMALDYDEFAQWPMIQVRVPPGTRAAYLHMTETAVGDRERFELLMRLAGWNGHAP